LFLSRPKGDGLHERAGVSEVNGNYTRSIMGRLKTYWRCGKGYLLFGQADLC